MTRVALASVLSLVYVVMLVASNARGIELFLIDVAAVTAFARYFPMPSGQGEPGIAIMVETGRQPVSRRMTVIATIAVPTTVNVVQFMTSVATRGRFLVALAWMAQIACNLAMAIRQRKVRSVMVELYMVNADGAVLKIVESQ